MTKQGFCSFLVSHLKCNSSEVTLQGIYFSLLHLPQFLFSRRSTAQFFIKVEHIRVKWWRHIFGIYSHGSETWSPVSIGVAAAVWNIIIYRCGLLSSAHVLNHNAQLRRKEEGQTWVTPSTVTEEVYDVHVTLAQLEVEPLGSKHLFGNGTVLKF